MPTLDLICFTLLYVLRMCRMLKCMDPFPVSATVTWIGIFLDFLQVQIPEIGVLHHNGWLATSTGSSSNRNNRLKVGQINLLTWAGLPQPERQSVPRQNGSPVKLYRVLQFACQWLDSSWRDKTWLPVDLYPAKPSIQFWHDWDTDGPPIMRQIGIKNLDHKCAVTIKQILRNGGVILMIYTAGFVI